MMEENAQMSLLPDAAVAAQMTMTGEEEIDLSEYEIVRPEFFAHIKEPASTRRAKSWWCWRKRRKQRMRCVSGAGRIIPSVSRARYFWTVSARWHRRSEHRTPACCTEGC